MVSDALRGVSYGEAKAAAALEEFLEKNELWLCAADWSERNDMTTLEMQMGAVRAILMAATEKGGE